MCFTARDNLAGRNLQRTFSPLAAPPSPTITLVRRASDEKTPPWLWADRQWRYSIIAMKSCPYMATAGNFIGKNEKCAGRGWAIVRHGGGVRGGLTRSSTWQTAYVRCCLEDFVNGVGVLQRAWLREKSLQSDSNGKVGIVNDSFVLET